MRKVVLLFVFSILSWSCSNDSSETTITKQSNSLNATSQKLPAGICPDGYVAVWTFETDLVFAKPFTTCRSGFGFCFIRTTISLDCKKLPTLSAKYYPDTDKMSVMIEALDDSTARIWIDSNVVTSPSHSSSDFDNIEIGDFELSPDATLTAGTYSKKTSGNFFYYDVPFK